MNKFEQIGYFKEYYQNGKFIGCITNIEKDREQIGYYGKKSETLEIDLIVNKKKLKKGSIVETMIYPLCGNEKKQ
jgi:hypothetical protein